MATFKECLGLSVGNDGLVRDSLFDLGVWSFEGGIDDFFTLERGFCFLGLGKESLWKLISVSLPGLMGPLCLNILLMVGWV